MARIFRIIAVLWSSAGEFHGIGFLGNQGLFKELGRIELAK